MSSTANNDHITIKFPDGEIKVDREKLCRESVVIATAVSGEWTEAASRTFENEDFNIVVGKQLLSWIDSKSYVVEEEVQCQPVLTTTRRSIDALERDQHPQIIYRILRAHVEVYGLADYYDIKRLKRYARKRFINAAQYGWVGDAFIELAERIYTATSTNAYGEPLREAFCDYAMQHRAQVQLVVPELGTNPHLQELAAKLFARTATLATEQKSTHNAVVRQVNKAYDEFRTEIQDLKAALRDDQSAADDLVKAIPKLPGVCPNPSCNLDFPANLAFERPTDWLSGRNKGKWIIKCGKCWKVFGEELEGGAGARNYPYHLWR